MSKQSVRRHKRRVARAGFPPPNPCHSCQMMVCAPCWNINDQGVLKREVGVNHCERHCRHKRSRDRVRTAEGVDSRGRRPPTSP